MAGVTDAPFRKIARDFGAGLACTEMISSEALVRGHRESSRLMDLSWDQRPVSVQLMGGDPVVMAQAARIAEAAGADIIDINMGCPVPKVVKTSGGSSLLRDPDRACRVSAAVVAAVSIPVTVKIRLGWDFATRNYLEMATRLKTGQAIPDLSWTEQIGLVRRHCDLVIDYYGAERGSRMLRKFIAWGLKGFRGAARLRSQVQSVSSPSDVAVVLDQALTIDPGDRTLDDDVDDEPASCAAA